MSTSETAREPENVPCWLCHGDGQWRPARCGICGVEDGDADVRCYDGTRGPVMRCPDCATNTMELFNRMYAAYPS